MSTVITGMLMTIAIPYKSQIYDSIIIMSRMAFMLRRWRPAVKRGMLPIIILPDGDFL